MSYNAKEYWNNLLEESCDDAGVCWPQWPLSYNKWLHKQQRETFELILQKYQFDFAKKSIFEIGTGSGFWSDILISKGCLIFKGFDISIVSTQKLQSKYPNHSFVECDFLSQFINLTTMRENNSTLGFVSKCFCI